MGLGSGRRGMKSPPLLIAVLLACVFVLGINYWITSSRCVELQNRVMELEGRMRRAAVERGAVEMKKNEYEDMLDKQKKQIESIQALHSGQMQTARLLCESEKEQLFNNITAKDNVVQTLQVQISNANKRLEDFKHEFKELEDTQAKKLSFELAQCSYKIVEAKEQCEEKLRKANVNNENPLNDETEKISRKIEMEKQTDKIQTALQEPEEKKDSTPQRNITVDLSQVRKSARNDYQVGNSVVNKENGNKLELNVVEKKPTAASQKPQPKVAVEDEEEQGPANEVKADSVNAAEDDEEIKAEDIVEKDGNRENEEVDRENLLNMEALQEESKGISQKKKKDDTENQNDYNGDDANEAEPEADKQAELIDNEPKDNKNFRKGQSLAQETEDDERALK